ncbi:MAG: hypothetical protein AB1757_13950 [Acidobacteriota bacterium]
MMRTKTKIEITIENRQRAAIRLRHQRAQWCEACAARVWMLVPNEAAAMLQTTARNIYRRVEAGEVHFLETEDGVLLICRNSLAQGLLIADWENIKRP